MIPPGLLDAVGEQKHVIQRLGLDVSYWMVLFTIQRLVRCNVLRGGEEIIRVIHGILGHGDISLF
jgi:hypothetical protein